VWNVGLCFWDGYWGAGVFHVGDVLGFVDFCPVVGSILPIGVCLFLGCPFLFRYDVFW